MRDVLESAPAIGNLLVLGERIGDQRKGPLIGLERFRQRLRRCLALFAGAVLQQVQRRFDRQLLGPDLEAQCGDGLIKQPVPGGVTALGFLVKQLLDAILQLIRLVLAPILPPPPAFRHFGPSLPPPSRAVCSASLPLESVSNATHSESIFSRSRVTSGASIPE